MNAAASSVVTHATPAHRGPKREIMSAPRRILQRSHQQVELGNALTHRLDDAPPTEQSPEGHRGVAARDDPEGQMISRGCTRGDQHQPDQAHALLRVVAA